MHGRQTQIWGPLWLCFEFSPHLCCVYHACRAAEISVSAAAGVLCIKGAAVWCVPTKRPPCGDSLPSEDHGPVESGIYVFAFLLKLRQTYTKLTTYSYIYVCEVNRLFFAGKSCGISPVCPSDRAKASGIICGNWIWYGERYGEWEWCQLSGKLIVIGSWIGIPSIRAWQFHKKIQSRERFW